MSMDLTDDKSTLVQLMAWCRQATSHYLSQCWPRVTASYGVTRPQWVNLLWPNDIIWHRFRSTLAHVMACCLTTSSHHQSQCWIIISKASWHSSAGNFTRYLRHPSLKIARTYPIISKISFKSPRSRWVNELEIYLLLCPNNPSKYPWTEHHWPLWPHYCRNWYCSVHQMCR